MSTKTILKAGLIASVGVAGLTLTANAQSRYGNVYDYESGRNCGQACVPAAPVAAAPVAASRYGAPAPQYNPAPVYVDCAQMGTCAPAPAVVYTQPAPVYTQPAYTQQSYQQSAQMAPVNCPAGTTAQSDGTCMQGGSSSYSTSTYSAPTTSYDSYSSSSSMGAPVDCPAGTTAQNDGTCMQGGSSSYSTSTYSAPTTSYDNYSSSSSMGAPVDCPAGTTAQGDGTCMQGGSSSSNSWSGSAVEIYTGDASTSSTTDTGSYTWQNDGSYGSTDYLPTRK